MYTEFFGLNEKPFSITPDPRYLYLSRRHADALAHLIYGISESGGFIQLTGEVGTGKTTLVRSLLEQLPDEAEIALILNPQLSSREFLENICEELGVETPAGDSIRALIGSLNSFLLKAHADGRRIVLIVDEAQTLSPELLEQVRLLTNLETATQKLLQIILIGQPELRDVLKRPEMRQIAQRITGRYHLEPLSRSETATYVRHRLRVAGCQAAVFTRSATAELFRRSGGIPRLINVVADRALLAAYAQERIRVDGALVRRAAAEVFGKRLASALWPWGLAAAGVAAVIVGGIDLWREARAPVQPVAVSIAAMPEPISAPAPAREDSGAAGRLPPADAVPPGPVVAAEREAAPPLAEFLAVPAFATDTEAAFEALFELWGAQYERSRGEPCVQAEEQGLKCLFEARGSISQLRTLNLPAILTLTDADGNTHDLVMKELGYSDAVFAGGDEPLAVNLSELTHHWFGDHLMLWRPAIESNRTLSPGTRGAEIVWLREALARIRGEDLEDAPSPLYDSALEARVRDYQRRKMLAVDGIVGSRTQLALTSDLGSPDVPSLRRKGY